jgi:hypothetical protein
MIETSSLVILCLKIARGGANIPPLDAEGGRHQASFSRFYLTNGITSCRCVAGASSSSQDLMEGRADKPSNRNGFPTCLTKHANPNLLVRHSNGAQKGILKMAGSPKDVELKSEKMVNAWETLAPNKTFGGMTLAQFQAVAQASQTARQQLAEIEAQKAQAIAAREAADEELLIKMQQVVNGVRADPTEGPDSALYESFGYTRKSERKTGLTRKKKSTKPPTT